VRRVPQWVLGSGAGLTAALALLLGPLALGAAAASSTSAATIYREAMATTKSWRVHYVSTSNISNVPFLESGDAGPASGTQSIRIGQGPTLDEASLIVIGDLTFVKGNVLAMEDLTGLSAAQAMTASGQWVVFSSNNSMFAQVVVGVRSHDVAQEVALKGPYTLERSRRVNGDKVDVVRGTETQGTTKMKADLYVRSTGRHLIVEENTVNSQGQANGAEHIVFSKWGESVKPRAPEASITLGSVTEA
jgi:hypothetical protein